MNAKFTPAISQSQIDIALTGCEFFLSTNNAGEVFANLRVGRKVQKEFPLFIGEIISRLENFEGATVIWQGLPQHGWYAIQFTSTLAHYISLASRCNPSNLPKNRNQTTQLLQDSIARRNRLAKSLIPSFPVIEDPWTTDTEFHGMCDLRKPCDLEVKAKRGSGRRLLLLPPVSIAPSPKSVKEETADLSKLAKMTKNEIARQYLSSWSKSRIAKTKKADLIKAAIEVCQLSIHTKLH